MDVTEETNINQKNASKSWQNNQFFVSTLHHNYVILYVGVRLNVRMSALCTNTSMHRLYTV